MIKKISYFIYLFCCAFMGAMGTRFGVNPTQWEWWVLVLAPAIAFICGMKYEQ